MTTAAEIMTRSVITIHPDASIADAVQLMLGQRISGLPVVDADGTLVGVLTEGDLLRRFETGTEKHRPRWLEFLRGPGQLAEDYVRTHGRKVREVMTDDVATAGEDATLESLVNTMESRRVRRVPIVTAGKLVGVVSRADLLKVLAKALDQRTAQAGSDEAIREAVIAELMRQDHGARARLSVVVTVGVVFLEGLIYDPRERTAMRVAAENVPGVKEVRDNIQVLDPGLGMATGL